MREKKERYYVVSIGMDSDNKLFPILPNITVHITQSHSFFSSNFNVVYYSNNKKSQKVRTSGYY